MMKFLYSCFLVLLIPAVMFGQYTRPGGAAGQFLKLGVSPKASAMGDAYIASTRGAEAVYYNPAALTKVEGISLVASHRQWFAGIDHSFFAMAHSFGSLGAVGISATSFISDLMKVRTPLQPEGTGETFYTSSIQVGVAYSRELTNHVSFGGGIKYVQISLYSDFIQEAFATDIAVLYTTEYRDFCFGMMVSNFGSSINFINEAYPLPLSFSFGLKINALELGSQVLTCSLSAIKPNDTQTLIRGGAEYNLHQNLFLRAGYHFNHDTANFTMGAGLKWTFVGRKLSFDYSFVNYDTLGGTNQFGISLSL